MLEKLILWLQRQLSAPLLSIRFQHDYHRFKKLARQTEARFVLRWRDRYPCLYDKTPTATFDRHYVFHTAWAARVLATTHPESHTDISSSLYFCSLVSAFVPIKFYDYRPAYLNLDGLVSGTADLLSLPFADRSIDSLSCMHVVEHVGLGRYGDPLDPDGDLNAMTELKRVLATGGQLLFVVPIGRPKLMFNAHRIYSYDQIMEYFSDLSLHEFSLIPDNAEQEGLIRNSTRSVANTQTYGCGCFWFRKP